MILEIFAIGAFIIGAYFYMDHRFNEAKVITKIARKLF